MKELDKIIEMNACSEAVEYLETKDTFKQAWTDCDRGDWMLWIAQKVGVDIKPLTKAKALCALTVKHLMKDERSIKACEVALLFSEDKASIKELADAAADAYSAAADAAAAAAYSAAAYSAAAAAYSAAYAYAAADAADAADADAAAADADAADAAAIRNRWLTSDICREVLTNEVLRLI